MDICDKCQELIDSNEGRFILCGKRYHIECINKQLQEYENMIFRIRTAIFFKRKANEIC